MARPSMALPRSNADMIKRIIASRVATSVERAGLGELLADEQVQSVEVHRVDVLTTQIRVVTSGRGTRYFIVRLSEML